MKNTRYLILAASLAAWATSAFAVAQTGNSRLGDGKVARRVIARIEGRLNITSDQRSQIKTILKTEEPTILALAAEAKQEREAIAAIPSYNEAAVREVAQRYAVTNTDIVVERAKVRLELRAVLTPEQLQKIDSFKGSLDGVLGERLDGFIHQL